MNIKREILRIMPLLIIGGIFLVPDLSDLKTVLFSLSIVTLIIYLARVVRKTMFPYLDLEDHMKVALDNPVAASIVFASIIYLITVIINSTVALIG